MDLHGIFLRLFQGNHHPFLIEYKCNCRNLIIRYCWISIKFSRSDLATFRAFGVWPSCRKDLKIIPVLWLPPLLSWIKVNTDELSKGNPGISVAAGVFRDTSNHFCGAFVVPLGSRSRFFAVVCVILRAIDLALTRGWFRIWSTESDSLSLHYPGFKIPFFLTAMASSQTLDSMLPAHETYEYPFFSHM